MYCEKKILSYPIGKINHWRILLPREIWSRWQFRVDQGEESKTPGKETSRRLLSETRTEKMRVWVNEPAGVMARREHTANSCPLGLVPGLAGEQGRSAQPEPQASGLNTGFSQGTPRMQRRDQLGACEGADLEWFWTYREVTGTVAYSDLDWSKSSGLEQHAWELGKLQRLEPSGKGCRVKRGLGMGF